MKKFNITNLKAELQELGASQFDIEAITNNASLYNDLVQLYKNGETHNMYLMYQLNGMILKQKNDLKKLNKKSTGEDVDDDTFKAMVDAVKNSKVKPVEGFKNKSSVETR